MWWIHGAETSFYPSFRRSASSPFGGRRRRAPPPYLQQLGPGHRHFYGSCRTSFGGPPAPEGLSGIAFNGYYRKRRWQGSEAGCQNGLKDGVDDVEVQENGGDMSLSLKRTATSDMDINMDQQEPATKRRKTGPPQPKNPISTLNELHPGLEYKTMGMEGPSHAPVFTVLVELNGQTFKGTGRSKKMAKHSAAEAALRSFLQFRNASDAAEALGINVTSVQDFTSDVSEASFATNSSAGEWWREA